LNTGFTFGDFLFLLFQGFEGVPLDNAKLMNLCNFRSPRYPPADREKVAGTDMDTDTVVCSTLLYLLNRPRLGDDQKYDGETDAGEDDVAFLYHLQKRRRGTSGERNATRVD
jgi:hypothetical protein